MRHSILNFVSQFPHSVVGLLLVIVGVAMSALGLRRVRRGTAMRRWLNTMARITKSRAVPAGDDGCEALVDYEYEVRGQRYRGQAVITGDSTNTKITDGKWMLTKYVPGEELLVYYDPAAPENSISPRFAWHTQTNWVFTGCLLVVLGILVAMT